MVLMLCEIAPDQALLRCHDWSRDDRARLSAHTAFVRTPHSPTGPWREGRVRCGCGLRIGAAEGIYPLTLPSPARRETVPGERPGGHVPRHAYGARPGTGDFDGCRSVLWPSIPRGGRLDAPRREEERMVAKIAEAVCLLAALALPWSGVAAQKTYPPGVSDSEIKIGQTMPYSGPASAYGTI